MTVQTRLDIDNVNLVVSGSTLVREDETISQIIGRATALLAKTVMAKNGAEWLPLQQVIPAAAPATCTTAAFGTDTVGFQAVGAAEFSIPVDGTTIEIVGLDLGDIATPLDTPAVLTCDTNGDLIAAWQAVTGAVVGDLRCVVNGVAHEWFGFDFAGIAALADIPAIINAQTVPDGLRFLYDVGGNIFSCVSTLTGQTATLGFLDEVLGGTHGTDISGSTGHGYLNGDGAPAAIVNGTGGIAGTSLEDMINAAAGGRFTVTRDPAAANQMVFISPTTGQGSAIGPLDHLAVPAGTDISVAGFLNGRAAAATLVAATGMDDINVPAGIYIGEDITAAALAAAHVHNCPILVAGPATINSTELVFEGGLTLTTAIPTLHKTIEDVLLGLGLTPEACIDIAGHENP
jgi:hypothetical protein